MPRVLSHELDAKAKEDADLWERCEVQDFEDDPRNRGCFRLTRKEAIELGLELDVSGDNDLNGPSNVSPTPARGYQSSSVRPRKRDQEHLDWRFRKDDELSLTADIDGGWRPTERAWYFHASAPVVLPRDYVLSSVVTIVEGVSGHWSRRSIAVDKASREAPEDCESVESVVPHFAPFESGSDPLHYVIEGSTCTFFVQLFSGDRELNTRLPWSLVESHWQFTVVEYGVFEVPVRLKGRSMSESRPFTIELRCTLQTPPRRQLQPEYEHDTPFPSAGLPSLGKRR